MKKVRLGFIGAGNMGQAAHLRNYHVIPDCEVCALAEVRPQLAEKVARRYGIERIYRDHVELLAAAGQIGLDGLVAIQPFVSHGSLVPELLEARLPLIIEKPLAHSVKAAKKIMTAHRATGTPLFVAYNKRSDPALIFCRSLLHEWHENGRYGQLRYIRISMPPGDWRAGAYAELIGTEEEYPSWKNSALSEDLGEAPNLEYTAFVNYYIHQVNLFRYLLEEDYQVTYADPAGIVMTLKSQSGVTGVLEMNTHGTTRDWQEKIFIAFERGWIKVDLAPPLAVNRAGLVRIFRDAGYEGEPIMSSPILPMLHSMRQQAVHFVEELQGKQTCLCTAEDAYKDLITAREYMKLSNSVTRK